LGSGLPLRLRMFLSPWRVQGHVPVLDTPPEQDAQDSLRIITETALAALGSLVSDPHHQRSIKARQGSARDGSEIVEYALVVGLGVVGQIGKRRMLLVLGPAPPSRGSCASWTRYGWASKDTSRISRSRTGHTKSAHVQ
jgi:hypothetical protein